MACGVTAFKDRIEDAEAEEPSERNVVDGGIVSFNVVASISCSEVRTRHKLISLRQKKLCLRILSGTTA